MMSGGGQERYEIRNIISTLCVGLGEACRIYSKEMESENKKLVKLKDAFLNGIRSKCDEIYLNGSEEKRVPGNLNLSLAYIEGESLMMGIKNLAVSSGSACTSASLEPSYVLKALGVEEELAHTSLRIGLGRFTTDDDVKHAVEKIVGEVKRLRALSPLWEMAQDGVDLTK